MRMLAHGTQRLLQLSTHARARTHAHATQHAHMPHTRIGPAGHILCVVLFRKSLIHQASCGFAKNIILIRSLALFSTIRAVALVCAIWSLALFSTILGILGGARSAVVQHIMVLWCSETYSLVANTFRRKSHQGNLLNKAIWTSVVLRAPLTLVASGPR